MVKPLTLEMSGSGVTDFALPEVKELARVHGLELDAFFSAYGVKALSTFRKKFAQEALAPPTPRAAAPTGLATSFEPAKPPPCEPMPLAEYGALAAKWEKSLKWRLVQRPGGAYISPDDWYRLYAAAKQASEGDVTTEKPMWTDRGGVDFSGQLAWQAWTEVKGLGAEEAKLKFCRVYSEAHTPARFGMNFHGSSAS